MSLVYTIAQLDALTEFKVQGRNGGSWWAHNWKRMVAEHGFPAPLPGIGKRRWPRALVDRWIANGGTLAEPAVEIKPKLAFNLDALGKSA